LKNKYKGKNVDQVKLHYIEKCSLFEKGALFFLHVLTSSALLTFVFIFQSESEYFETFKG